MEREKLRNRLQFEYEKVNRNEALFGKVGSVGEGSPHTVIIIG